MGGYDDLLHDDEMLSFVGKVLSEAWMLGGRIEQGAQIDHSVLRAPEDHE